MSRLYTRIARPTLWLVRGGLARIGGPEPDAQPSFEVEVPSFYISKTAVTNAHFSAFCPSFTPATASPGPEHPAVGVTLDDALAYCGWYSELSGKHFRLPTEVEWEYACRAGTRTRYFFGDDPKNAEPFVWSAENTGDSAPPVEQKDPNPAGLHDMLGGVREWTSSVFAPYPSSPDEPSADSLEADVLRVVRGGSFRTPLPEIGSGARAGVPRAQSADDLGFRIVRRL